MYANAAWANLTKSNLNKIQREQNKAIRLAYSLHPTKFEQNSKQR